jgi:photosystem II stability/assembly factor-like uncharacterized protein
MKRFIGILLLVLGSTLTVYALPQGWEWQAPRPQGYDLLSVDFVDAQTGWAVGVLGTILHTTSAGQLWEPLPSPTTADLYSVEFLDAQNGWILSADAVGHTSDAGTHWTFQAVTVPVFQLSRVLFTDPQHGWIYGYENIMRTTDGGTTWSTIIVSPPQWESWNCLSFVDANNGWIGSSAGTVMRTRDGGLSWGDMRVVDSGGWMTAIQFVDTTSGWATGGQVCHTGNGGRTWTHENASGNWLSFPDMHHGWVIGYDQLYATTSGGTTWFIQSPGDPTHPQNVYVGRAIVSVDSLHAWIVGVGGFIVHTVDGGVTWEEQVGYAMTNLCSVHFPDLQNGWAVGTYYMGNVFHGIVRHTSSGGQVWIDQDTIPNVATAKIQFIDNQTGWIIGNQADDLMTSVLMQSTDGGQSWSSRWPQTLNDSYFLSDLAMADGSNGWVVGYQLWSHPGHGLILHTSNGGTSWDVQDSSAAHYYAISASDANHAWTVADSGLYATSDGGIHWVERFPGERQSFSLFDVSFVDNQHGWAGGQIDSTFSSFLIRTADGGETWTSLTIPDTSPIIEVQWITVSDGWVRTRNDHLYHSTDSGDTWSATVLQTGGSIGSMYFPTVEDGWVVGGGAGFILHYHQPEASVAPSESPLPRSFSLNAYPNPFNPATQITFRLPERTIGHLAIYDITGRMIRILSSGFFEAGDHNFRWDSRDNGGNPVTTGIYFCRFSSNKISATQRLLLLK